MPSSLIGKSGDRWRLRPGSLTMLRCLRLGVRPSALWIAGLMFPSVGLSFYGLQYVLRLLGNVADVPVFEALIERESLWLPWSPSAILNVFSFDYSQAGAGARLVASLTMLLCVLPLGCRLSAALARVADEPHWKEAAQNRRAPSLRDAWRHSRGMTLEIFGLWLCLQGLLFGCFGLVMGPILLLVNQLHLELLGNFLLIPLALPLLLIFLYASVLGALNQLALPSLVFNRRGPASALTHAWRLVRSDPWAVTRAMLIDLALQIVLFRMNPGEGKWDIFLALMFGITGVARACYWARVYTELGGLRAVDGVPGLPSQGSGGAGPDASNAGPGSSSKLGSGQPRLA
jgi:hypothetical protein